MHLYPRPAALEQSLRLLHSGGDHRQVKVIVLAPYVSTNDPNLDYYYDFSQSIAEYNKAFLALGLDWEWKPVTMLDQTEVIAQYADIAANGDYIPILFNLCDGDEVNGTPGISVVENLHRTGMIHTGSEAAFYRNTTSKVTMKKAFDAHGVPHAPWMEISSPEQDVRGIFKQVGKTIIVKPAVSGGSMGLGIQNVVETEAALKEQVERIFAGYRGWELASGGIVAEAFIEGPEFTTLITGSAIRPRKSVIYHPVERIFHHSLPAKEKFLSFDRLWETYDEESPMPGDGDFYQYTSAARKVAREIKQVSWDAFVATEGTGYTRADVRMHEKTGALFVLEVNAQCGLSEDENYTSIGAILRVNEKSFSAMISEIIYDGVLRHKAHKISSNKAELLHVDRS
ncbi:MAG: hypothetical protein R2794_08695 [Chitinophagales bacterium]